MAACLLSGCNSDMIAGLQHHHRMAAAQGTSDQTLLANIATNSPDLEARAVAVRKITNEVVLANIATNASDSKVAVIAVRKLTNQVLLANIAAGIRDYHTFRRDHNYGSSNLPKRDQGIAYVGLAAARRLTNQAMLAEVLANRSSSKTDKYFPPGAVELEGVSKTLMDNLTDQMSLARVVVQSVNLRILRASWNKLTDRGILLMLRTNDSDAAVRFCARLRLGEDPQRCLIEMMRKPTQTFHGAYTTVKAAGYIFDFPQADWLANLLVAVCIRQGDNNRIPELREHLANHGTQSEAKLFLNCGNQELEEAAELWAKRHGFEVVRSSSGEYHVNWGREQSK